MHGLKREWNIFGHLISLESYKNGFKVIFEMFHWVLTFVIIFWGVNFQVGKCWNLVRGHFVVHDCSTFGRTDLQTLFIPVERKSNVTQGLLADFHSHTGSLENPQTVIIKRLVSAGF
jgi:hypothetical protein